MFDQVNFTCSCVQFYYEYQYFYSSTTAARINRSKSLFLAALFIYVKYFVCISCIHTTLYCLEENMFQCCLHKIQLNLFSFIVTVVTVAFEAMNNQDYDHHKVGNWNASSSKIMSELNYVTLTGITIIWWYLESKFFCKCVCL